MKRRMSGLTLGFSLLSLGFIALAYMEQATTLALVASAICWLAGFAWFIRLGRQAKGWQRYVFAAAFWVLCVCLVGCAAWCVWNIVKG